MDENVDMERIVTDWGDLGEEKPVRESSQRLERFGWKLLENSLLKTEVRNVQN